MPSVSTLIIGDEILKGTFEDQNGPWLIEKLRKVGARLELLVVLPDKVEVIAEYVARCSGSSDWVITTGGVGPTHDDVTMEGIASAFGLQLQENEKLLELMQGWGVLERGGGRRMARLPVGAKVLHTDGFPVIQVRNVFILPGVPDLMKRKFLEIERHFHGVRPSTGSWLFSGRESHYTEEIDALVEAFPSLTIGSYPRKEAGEYAVMLTFEGFDPQGVAQAIQWAKDRFPALNPT